MIQRCLCRKGEKSKTGSAQDATPRGWFTFVTDRRKHPDHPVVLPPCIVIGIPHACYMHLCSNFNATNASSLEWEQREWPYRWCGCVLPREFDGEVATELRWLTTSRGSTAISDGLPRCERGAGILERAFGFRSLATASHVVIGRVGEKEHGAERF